MNTSVLTFEIIDNVAIIKMDNPPVNALTPAFLDEFLQIIEKLCKPGKARAALIASDCPGFFSVGDDVTELKEIDEAMVALLPKVHAMMNAFETLPIPTVAAINGHALGGGLELALTCDFRFMGEDSGRIGLPEIRLGMIPSFGGTQRLPLIVGKAKAIEMMYKGLQITPEEAKQINLINNVFPKKELYEKSFDYAGRLALQATGALAKIKKCVHTGLHEGFAKGLAMEQKTFRENIFTHDVKEGIDAFLSGRKPEFKG
ncbi:MAG: enoyl-CoA hydratase/isomerase family protein [Deltaproteobacteria bacterium]|nr:enoyl-CoA hydratase/isomerase family protein [Deltaproteobacteria bacterium]MBW2219080.1 enoyl-CoA hydratase/isomerase family protein [Deltaproteobacteria bacterium]